MANKPHNYWTYEKCLEDAKLYNNLLPWAVGPGGGYKKAYTKGWLRKIGRELGWKFRTAAKQYRKKPTFEECVRLSVNYTCLENLLQEDRCLHTYCKKKGWLKLLVEAHQWNYRGGISRTYDACKQIAKDYHRLLAWKIGDSKSYRYAVKRGWQKTIARELSWPEQKKKK